MKLDQIKISIIGLGYVGLPLAIEFSKKYPVIGYDINKNRVSELQNGFDKTKEADIEELKILHSSRDLKKGFFLDFTNDISKISDSNVYIVTVPTPINQFKSPDLQPLLSATSMIGKLPKKGDLIIYESTVYPGCTEEDCVPVLEKISGLKFNQDFYCGYSPERINPGDKLNTLTKIKKVTSGSTTEIADFVDKLYSSIIIAGTHKAPSIKVAEASKAIENAQRDVNISFVNELALIFDKIGIDTMDVLEAAGTKWNFLKYYPGLVGGHCIGVDPYYLAHKAESMGYYPQVILSGRRVNDNIGTFVANKVIKLMINKGISVKKSKILILGITFKENCPDIRNTKVVDIYNELIEFGANVEIFDPWASKEEVKTEYNIELNDKIGNHDFDAYILAVSHKEFLAFNNFKKGSIVYDIKGILNRDLVTARL